MLQNRGHLQLRQVREQLVEFVLARAVDYQVCAEREDAGRQDRQNLKTFEAQNSVPNLIYLVYLYHIHKCEVEPWEHRLQWIDPELVQVVAYFGLVSLQ